jgi:RNA polymerase sigma-70 factor, ECF subfamily
VKIKKIESDDPTFDIRNCSVVANPFSGTTLEPIGILKSGGSMSETSDTVWTAERVFREHASRVYNLSRRMLGNDADAEDVTQDVLLQVVRKLDTFRGDAAITTWLHRVTVNAALALRKKRSRNEAGRVYDPLENFTDEGQHTGFVRPWPKMPEEMALDAEQKKAIENAIAQLPDIYRDAFVLADVEQLPNNEIGELLELSLPAVKSRLHRARLMMRDLLTGYFEGQL